MKKAPKKRLGEILMERGIVSSDQLRIALTEQKKNPEHLGKILVRLGFASEAVIRDILSGSLGKISIDLDLAVLDQEAVAMIPKEMAQKLKVLPLNYQEKERKLIIAMTDIYDLVVLDQITRHVGDLITVEQVLAAETDIVKGIDKFYGYTLSVDGILHEIETGEVDYQSLNIETDEYSQPIVRLVNALLSDAVRREASDIHFEPEEGFVRFRYRIDGVLRQIRSLHKNYWPAIAVRLKVMSEMNIAETREPQDGRFSIILYGHRIDFRASTLPTAHGENIVLRILDRQKGIVAIDNLGLNQETLNNLKFMLARPEGMILVTGPTGSGKTTTLYSVLLYLNTEEVNIMTLEDPVEYPTLMLRQTHAQENSKLDFADGIRAILRQDPDIILVGEIRDQETANMAFRAAMTGHQVFATLHTNSAIGSISRLLDIGIKPSILAGNVIGIVAQRLARKLCKNCKQKIPMDDITRKLLGLQTKQVNENIYSAQGCRECNQGYQGRKAIMELLRMDSDLDELIVRNASFREISRVAFAKGFQPLIHNAVNLVLQGETSIEEISRVIDLTPHLSQT